MARPKGGTPRGILNPDEGKRQFQLSRFLPSGELDFFVEHYWIVEWDLGNNSYQQDILAYPSVQVVFERENTKIWGVVTGKFSRTIKGRGKVFGIKFRPGGFYPFCKSPVSSFTDDTATLDRVFDVNTGKMEKWILESDDKEKMVERGEAFVRQFVPAEDERVPFINTIIDAVREDINLIKVDQLAEQFNISERSIQRMFKRYVGVSPKWVIKRYRLHEVAGKLSENEHIDWAELAVDLGYFDQAHFIRDFKTIVGESPGRYSDRINQQTMK